MMDNKMICVDGFENVVEGGKTSGFVFLGRLPYFLGLGLSMIEVITVTVHGNTYTLDEMETVYDDRWNFGEKATIGVARAGGLTPGRHRIEFAVRMRVSYLPFVPTTKDVKELDLAA